MLVPKLVLGSRERVSKYLAFLHDGCCEQRRLGSDERCSERADDLVDQREGCRRALDVPRVALLAIPTNRGVRQRQKPAQIFDVS